MEAQKWVFSNRFPNTLSLVKQTETPAPKSCHWFQPLCCYGAQTEQCFNSTKVFTLCRESTFEWFTHIFHHLISPSSRTALFEHIKPLPNFTWYSQHDFLMDCVLYFARWKRAIALYSKNGKHMLPLHCVFCQRNKAISPIGCHKHWLCMHSKIIWFACFSETIAGYSCLGRAPLLKSKCVNLTGKSKHT